MKKITLHDGRIANFPDGVKPHVVGKTIARLMMADGGKADIDAEEKKKKEEQKKRDETDELRHKEKIAVGLQGVKASQERNKSSADNVKATKEAGLNIGKTLEGNAGKIIIELSNIRKSLDGLAGTAKQLKELSSCVDELGDKIEIATKTIVAAMLKPKKVIRSERGALTGIQSED